MSEETTAEGTATDAAPDQTTSEPQLAADISGSATPPQVHPAEFPEAVPRRTGLRSTLDRFSDVQVEISVEIGRVTMRLGEMMQLGPGSVVELDRDINEPVTITAQGVRIASGEVVVINDRFAVRITDVAETGGQSSDAGEPS